MIETIESLKTLSDFVQFHLQSFAVRKHDVDKRNIYLHSELSKNSIIT